MKKLLVGCGAAVVLVAAVVVAQQAPKIPEPIGEAAFQSKIDGRNPWSHLRFTDSQDFQFAVVSDRTGGHREKIFSKAVEQLNLMQPEFVLSVGDLIEGYSTDRDKVMDQWKEFQSFTSRLQMPFFYVPGNHDVTNESQGKIWDEKFGRRHYHFIYKNVLFLVLDSDDPPGKSAMSEAQVKWAKQTLAENADVRWTIVSFHKPVWTGDNATNGWGEIEKSLAGRNYTVFVGHVHRYQKFVRNGMNYYQLATTGGGSRLRGVRYGEFDHVVWVTMKKNGPVLANLMLDGILPEDLKSPETQEPVTVLDRKAVHPTRGYVYLDGAPLTGAVISFHAKNETAKEGAKPTFRFVGDSILEGDGSFAISTYALGDGAPVGEYAVTVSFESRYGSGSDRKDIIPAKYLRADTSPLKVTVKAGKNEFTLDLQK